MPIRLATRLAWTCTFAAALAAFAAAAGPGPSPAGHPAAAANSAPNTLSPEERAAGWRLLFDGKTGAGWHGYRGKALPPEWQVAGGELILKRSDGVLREGLSTADEYADFELLLEWKLTEGGNSGILYRVSEDGKHPYETGPEMQILDDDRHPDAKKGPERRCGSCYALYAPSKAAAAPIGQWNRVRLVVRGRHVEQWLNGEKVVEYELFGDDWSARVSKSKFAKMAGYGKSAKGHIVLQDHGHEVAFRSIKIRALP